ncbi:uncharacterized protein V1518DRAFT_421748 [Limtongia smithiae]|uniref:uncharacterized protein n=1 Tax=Limtongia smithiae TaxID=1125753 RepID=UPI0034CE9407
MARSRVVISSVRVLLLRLIPSPHVLHPYMFRAPCRLRNVTHQLSVCRCRSVTAKSVISRPTCHIAELLSNRTGSLVCFTAVPLCLLLWAILSRAPAVQSTPRPASLRDAPARVLSIALMLARGYGIVAVVHIRSQIGRLRQRPCSCGCSTLDLRSITADSGGKPRSL